MKPEELIALLGEQGLQEEEIATLCQGVIQVLGGGEGEEEQAPEQPEETEDEKMNRVFNLK